MPYFEVAVNRNCNLNCKGCNHFCNLYQEETEENIYPLEEYKKDIFTLSKKIDGIFRFRILGGEPLLHPALTDILKASRSAFPEADIRLVTNGLLIPKMDDVFFHIVKSEKIGVDISLYPPTSKVKGRIEEKLLEKRISYNFENIEGPVLDMFAKNLAPFQRNNPNMSMNKCIQHQCRMLFRGRVYKCPMEAFVGRFFETYFPKMKVPESSSVLVTENMNAVKTFENLKKTCPTCRICSEQGMLAFAWDTAVQPNKEDWLVENQMNMEREELKEA